MIRVLHVYPQMNNAGTETVIMNLYRNVDRNQVQFDFLTMRGGEFDGEVAALGGVIYTVPGGSGYHRRLMGFFGEHGEYRIVHTHTHAEMGEVLRCARKSGVPFRIAHSHNSRGDLPAIARAAKGLASLPIERNATHLLACSEEAAEWLFPHRADECVVWKNAIDLERFRFRPDVRAAVRERLRIPASARVVCHVGRFAEQKNHRRIMRIANGMMLRDPELYLLLVGTGPLLEETREMAVCERALFLGSRTDVPDLLSASDAFLFPSLYEGLGTAAVEAQASGILCVASTRVPKAADVGSGLFERLDLDAPDELWTAALERGLGLGLGGRAERSALAAHSDYSIAKAAKAAQGFYESLERGTL